MSSETQGSLDFMWMHLSHGFTIASFSSQSLIQKIPESTFKMLLLSHLARLQSARLSEDKAQRLK